MNEKIEISVSVKDYFLYTLKRWRIIMITAFLCALTVVGIIVIKSMVTWDDDNKKYDEKIEQYENDRAAYEDYLKALQNGVQIYEDEYEKEDIYINNSILINLDYENLVIVNTKLTLSQISEDIYYDDESYEFAFKLYCDNLYNFADWDSICKVIGCEPQYVIELIGLDVDYESHLISLNVVYSDEQVAYTIADMLIKGAKDKVSEVKIYDNFELIITDQHTENGYSAWLKNIIDYAYGRYDMAKSSYEEAKANVENYIIDGKPKYPEKPDKLSKKYIALYSVKWFLITFLSVITVFFVFYYFLFVNRGIIYSADEFDRITGLNNLGILPRKDDKKDDTSVEAALERIRIHMDFFSELNNILVIDNCDDSHKNEIIDLLSSVSGKSFSYYPDFTSYEALEKLRECDGVIFIVKREKTMLNEILSNKKFVQERGKKIIGSIIL